jgi:hypothetical protein
VPVGLGLQGARARLDVDVYRDAVRQVAEAQLRQAAGMDPGDWCRFEVGMGMAIGTSSVRLPVRSIIGASVWVAFHIDLAGADLRLTGRPEHVPP